MFRQTYPSFDRYRLIHNVTVSMNDVRPLLTDSKNFNEAIQAHLDIREQQWLEENPRPSQVRLIQGWFMKKLNELYPDYQFLVDGEEISTNEALRLGIFTWNIELQLTYDDQLGQALEKEKSL